MASKQDICTAKARTGLPRRYPGKKISALKHALRIAALLPLFLSCNKTPEHVQPAVGQITESVYASGIIKSQNQYQVFSTVGGLVQKIWVREGDLVKQGDPLFTIQSEIARLGAENAQLSADFAEMNTRGERLSELHSAIETARSKMLYDSLLFVRQRELWAQQIGSKVELEQRELTYMTSTANYEAALLRYSDLQKQLEFAAAQARKQLSISRNNAQDYIIRSRTDGRVYNIARELGEIVNTQLPVAVIGDANRFIAELQVDESDITRIRAGQRTLLTMDSYKGQVLEAVISQIDPLMNERTRTFTVEAAFTQQPPALYPNLSAEANIIIQTKENALTIPRTCLLDDSTVVLSDGDKRKVATGLKDYEKVEIVQGLDASETIIKPAK